MAVYLASRPLTARSPRCQEDAVGISAVSNTLSAKGAEEVREWVLLLALLGWGLLRFLSNRGIGGAYLHAFGPKPLSASRYRILALLLVTSWVRNSDVPDTGTASTVSKRFLVVNMSTVKVLHSPQADMADAIRQDGNRLTLLGSESGAPSGITDDAAEYVFKQNNTVPRASLAADGSRIDCGEMVRLRPLVPTGAVLRYAWPSRSMGFSVASVGPIEARRGIPIHAEPMNCYRNPFPSCH